MKFTFRRVSAASSLTAGLVLSLAAIASAHETWLMPNAMRVAVGETVTLELTSGMAFAGADYAIAPARVTGRSARLARRTERLTVVRRGKHALALRWTPKTAGIAAVSVTLAPKRLELDSMQAREYFEEIHAAATLREEWAAMPAPRRWREEYVKSATSFIRVGTPQETDSSWRVPAGVPLEVVPSGDPTALRAGDSLTVVVLLRGKPLADFMVGAMAARAAGDSTSQSSEEQFVRTDSAGRARIVFPSSGRWLVHGTDLRRVRGDAHLEWRSNFTTLTIAVLPATAP